MADQESIAWLRERLQASLALEPKDPAEILDWLEARRKHVPFSAELIPLREVAGWQRADNGNIFSETGVLLYRGRQGTKRSRPERDIRLGSADLHAVRRWRSGLAVPRDAGPRHRVPAAGQGRSGQYRLPAVLPDDPEHLGKHPRPERRRAQRSRNVSTRPTISA